jgi:regulator of RNase E activity RraA
MFASAAIVSHAYVHLVDFGTPVKIGGTVIRSGDLIHADQHGAIVIPIEIAAAIPEAAAEVERTERRIINYCKSSEFSADGLKELYRR